MSQFVLKEDKRELERFYQKHESVQKASGAQRACLSRTNMQLSFEMDASIIPSLSQRGPP